VAGCTWRSRVPRARPVRTWRPPPVWLLPPRLLPLPQSVTFRVWQAASKLFFAFRADLAASDIARRPLCAYQAPVTRRGGHGEKEAPPPAAPAARHRQQPGTRGAARVAGCCTACALATCRCAVAAPPRRLRLVLHAGCWARGVRDVAPSTAAPAFPLPASPAPRLFLLFLSLPSLSSPRRTHLPAWLPPSEPASLFPGGQRPAGAPRTTHRLASTTLPCPMAAALSPALKAAFEAASLPGDAAPPRALHVVPQARGALELEAQLPPAAGKTDREEWDGTLKQVSVAKQWQRIGTLERGGISCASRSCGRTPASPRMAGHRPRFALLHLRLALHSETAADVVRTRSSRRRRRRRPTCSGASTRAPQLVCTSGCSWPSARPARP
jgi:hypothetical protein